MVLNLGKLTNPWVLFVGSIIVSFLAFNSFSVIHEGIFLLFVAVLTISSVIGLICACDYNEPRLLFVCLGIILGVFLTSFNSEWYTSGEDRLYVNPQTQQSCVSTLSEKGYIYRLPEECQKISGLRGFVLVDQFLINPLTKQQEKDTIKIFYEVDTTFAMNNPQINDYEVILENYLTGMVELHQGVDLEAIESGVCPKFQRVFQTESCPFIITGYAR